MIAYARIDQNWREAQMVRGLAQGRPASPVLAAILLNPCIIKAAHLAMRNAAEMTLEQAKRDLGAAGYLDDVTLDGQRREDVCRLRLLHV